LLGVPECLEYSENRLRRFEMSCGRLAERGSYLVARMCRSNQRHGKSVITLKTIAAISPNSTTWDEGKGAVTGFGARRQKGTAVAYIVKYRRADGRQRWATRRGSPHPR
jgi:hypothetical protein